MIAAAAIAGGLVGYCLLIRCVAHAVSWYQWERAPWRVRFGHRSRFIYTTNWLGMTQTSTLGARVKSADGLYWIVTKHKVGPFGCDVYGYRVRP